MSNITLDEVKKVAKLGRLRIRDGEAEKFRTQLNSILEYASKLNEIDTTSVEPTSHSIPMKNVFREDEPVESFERELITSNAPQPERGFYKVPKIIE
ncbi:MAG TPA: Asp-tRNA(Asn)/Glu-tRNA(Gln) amidotransferase subunit GatC [bacterium]|nr:Asp-tRNA(Asn)/Glu-tRNA(Gln) amidotransferase subunit GatC [bacterium]HPN32727.1 Asp-tRNA(Asn)/Glu-tRNA(Gln) amidotransferase subunit GatC [bacterium]